MALSSSPTNKAMASASDTTHHDQDQDRHPLNCPRCDSSNTKFCYYNNYSLSQPRHFCKACKRYWTRGGTLRNVPVGGGCRKNKRPKRHSDGISSSSSAAAASPSIQPQMNIQSPLFYGLATNPLELSFPFSSFRVSSDAAGFDLQPRIDSLGLGFSQSSNGFKPIQDGISNSSTSSPFSTSGNNSIFFFGSSSSFSASSTMESLLASSLQQQQESITIPSLMPYDESHMLGNGIGKEVKAGGGNRSPWNPNPDPNPTPMGRINSSDPSSLIWNTTSNGALFDPSAMDSSVPSLI